MTASPKVPISAVFCTFFDSGYLSRGLSLISSIRNQGDQTPVYVLCLDQITEEYLISAALPGVHTLHISQLEAREPRLESLKLERSRMEYYFTCTPQLFMLLFDEINTPGTIVSYIDADLYFYAPPTRIFEALGSNSVGITEHRYSAGMAPKLAGYGRFNAGFLCFKDDTEGRNVLQWWAEKAIEWCSDKPDSGRYANQGYLNWFPDFPGVQIFDSPGFNTAPWNTGGHTITTGNDGKPLVDGKELVFFHFHGLRRVDDWFVTSELIYGSRLTKELKNDIYVPYAIELELQDKIVNKSLGTSARMSKRGNGIHGLIGRARKYAIDRLSILTGNAFKI